MMRQFITLCDEWQGLNILQDDYLVMVYHGLSTLLQGMGGGNLYLGGLLMMVFALVLGYWVYKDAGGRGKDNALLWGLGVGILTLLTLIGGLLALGFYIYTRD